RAIFLVIIMDVDNQIIDESYCIFGAEALLNRLDALEKEIPGVMKSEDIECVHRMRVASRRLRSAFLLFESCFPEDNIKKWKKQIRRVTRTLGKARDLDVQIEFVKDFLTNVKESRYIPGIKRLVLRLQQKRQKVQIDVISMLEKIQSNGTISEIKNSLKSMLNTGLLHKKNEYSNYVYDMAYKEIESHIDKFLFYERYIEDLNRIAELHLMRICAKRLRYTMEIFSPLYDNKLEKPIKITREIQDLLGEIHDCFVWIEYLDQFIEEEKNRTLEYFGNTKAFSRLKAGLIHLQENRKKHQIKKHKEFLKFWEEIGADDVWKETIKYVYNYSKKGEVL
ncbi:MAG: CHAD domain-containing protein, partial [Candidatus Poribacteria bacterium]